MQRITIIAALAIVGCGAPQYQLVPTTADNLIDVEKTAMGFKGTIRVGADSEGSLRGVVLKRGDLELKLDDATFAAKPSATYAASGVPMQAYRDQTQAFYEGNTMLAQAHWAGFNQALATAAPLVGQYMAGRLSLRQAELAAPNMRRELIQGFAGGNIDLNQLQAVLGQMPSSVAGGFFDDPRVVAAIEALRKDLEALRPPTTQPTEN